jgi:hypothetical protein
METKDMRTVQAFGLALVQPSLRHAVLTFSHLPYDGAGPMDPQQSIPFVMAKHQLLELARFLQHVAQQMPETESPTAQ